MKGFTLDWSELLNISLFLDIKITGSSPSPEVD